MSADKPLREDIFSYVKTRLAGERQDKEWRDRPLTSVEQETVSRLPREMSPDELAERLVRLRSRERKLVEALKDALLRSNTLGTLATKVRAAIEENDDGKSIR